jgi:hypothetical protein
MFKGRMINKKEKKERKIIRIRKKKLFQKILNYFRLPQKNPYILKTSKAKVIRCKIFESNNK